MRPPQSTYLLKEMINHWIKHLQNLHRTLKNCDSWYRFSEKCAWHSQSTQSSPSGSLFCLAPELTHTGQSGHPSGQWAASRVSPALRPINAVGKVLHFKKWTGRQDKISEHTRDGFCTTFVSDTWVMRVCGLCVMSGVYKWMGSFVTWLTACCRPCAVWGRALDLNPGPFSQDLCALGRCLDLNVSQFI